MFRDALRHSAPVAHAGRLLRRVAGHRESQCVGRNDRTGSHADPRQPVVGPIRSPAGDALVADCRRSVRDAVCRGDRLRPVVGTAWSAGNGHRRRAGGSNGLPRRGDCTERARSRDGALHRRQRIRRDERPRRLGAARGCRRLANRAGRPRCGRRDRGIAVLARAAEFAQLPRAQPGTARAVA